MSMQLEKVSGSPYCDCAAAFGGEVSGRNGSNGKGRKWG